jgi:hypothetical protein
MVKFELDTKKLAEANIVVHKWMEMYDISRQHASCFVKQVISNSGCFYEILSAEDQTAILVEMDLFKFLAENENEFISSNKPLMYKVAGEFRFPVGVDFETNGMLAMHRAFYYYTDASIPFVNFCCNGIQQEFKGLIRQNNTNKQRIWRSVGYIQKKHIEAFPDRPHITDALVAEEETAEDAFAVLLSQGGDMMPLLQKICSVAKLNAQETTLINALVSRNTSGDWVSKFLLETGLTISKQAVYLKKDALMKKLRLVVKTVGIDLFRN